MTESIRLMEVGIVRNMIGGHFIHNIITELNEHGMNGVIRNRDHKHCSTAQIRYRILQDCESIDHA